MRNIYEDAILVQDACNLSGVVHSLAKAMDVIRKEADELGEGTQYMNTHPVVILFVDKLQSLSGSNDPSAFSRAYDKCQKMAELTAKKEGISIP